MSWPRRKLFALLAGFGLAGSLGACGFEPLYGNHGLDRGTNADLAAGYERVVVIAPLARGFGPIAGLDGHVRELTARGSAVAVVKPDKAALEAIGKNVLDPARRPAAARAGHAQAAAVLAAVIVPRALFRELEEIIGVADTKTAHTPRYWEELFGRIEFYRPQGLDWAIAQTPPEEFDRGSINRLLDRDYERLLGESMRRIDPKRARVVLDDYGPGPALERHFKQLRESGAEVVRATRADDRYLECRLASLVAKREQQQALDAIRRDKRYALEGQELGSGNPGDPKTRRGLRALHRTGRTWPPFRQR